MTNLLDLLVSWRAFVLILLVFGFAPGAVLRLIVHAFPAGDLRRDELLAELPAVPWAERPLWVAAQLEVALFEGLWGRVVWSATGRIIYRWHLTSGVERHREHPDTFEIPSPVQKACIAPGDSVKAMFEMEDPEPWCERMWVDVVKVKRRHIVGRLRNEPVGIPRLGPGDKVKVKFDHVIDIIWCDADQPPSLGPAVPVCDACALGPLAGSEVPPPEPD